MLFFGSNNIAHLHKRGEKKNVLYIIQESDTLHIYPDSCTALKYDFKIVVDPLCHLQRLPFVIRRVVNDSQLPSRGVVPGGAGGAMAPPDFGR